MFAWLSYLVERFRPYVSLPVIMGVALSGSVMGGLLFSPFPFFCSSFAIFLIFFILRLSDDIEDLDKDKIAYPARALPRGLIGKQAAIEGKQALLWLLLVYLLALFVIFSFQTKGMVLVTGSYLYLLLNPGKLAAVLQRRPFFKMFVEQGMMFVAALLAVSISWPELAFSVQSFSYALLVFAAFSTFEICCKLDPFLHPIHLTVLHYYGFKATFALLCLLQLFGACGAYGMGVERWLWPLQAAVLLTLLPLFIRPRSFSVPRAVSAVSLIVHAFAGVLQHINPAF